MFRNFPRSLLLSTQLSASMCLGQKDDVKAAFTAGHIAGGFVARGAMETRGLQKTPAFPVTTRQSLLFYALDCSFCCGAGDRPQGLSSPRKVFYH